MKKNIMHYGCMLLMVMMGSLVAQAQSVILQIDVPIALLQRKAEQQAAGGETIRLTGYLTHGAIGRFVLSNDALQNIVPPIAMSEQAQHTDASPALPTEYAMRTNYPNPFNPSTTLTYALPERSSVRLAVYNVVGQQVALLVDGEQSPGWHAATWRASGASGVYLYVLEARGVESASARFVYRGKMVLAK